MPQLTIKAPNSGISSSPHVGFGDCRNLDIASIPGVCRLNNLLAKKSSTTVTNTVKWFRKDPVTPTICYALDAGGVLYKSTDSGDTWAIVSGNSFTVTIASPAVFSSTGHGLLENDTVVFATTGALPTGLVAGTTYYVIATGLTADAFEVSTSQGGAAVNTSGTQSGTQTFRITTNANGNGLEIWKNYVFVARNAKLDVYSGSAWTNNWKTIDSDTLWHPMFVSKNDYMLYGGASRYVYSLEEVSGQTFAPGTAATFTWTQQALDLPPNYRIKCLEEQGNNLMIGTWMGSNIYDFKVADIFPWDRSSPSFGQPVVMNENGVNAMININGILYVLAGIEGKIYSSNGIQANVIGQIPSSIANIEGGLYLEPFPGAIMNYKGRLFFGVSNSTSTNIDGMGIWSLSQTASGNILNLEHSISTGNWGASSLIKVGAICPINRDSFLCGWKDGTSYGIDKVTNTSRVTSYGGYFESPLYIVGIPEGKTDFPRGQIQFAEPLGSGEGVQISYRTSTTGSYTTIVTIDYATYGSIQGKFFHLGIEKVDTIQFKVAFTTGSSSNTSPKFKQLIIQ